MTGTPTRATARWPTATALLALGPTRHHRPSFGLVRQLSLDLVVAETAD